MDHVSFLASLWCTAITEMVHADYRNGASHLPNKWCTHLTEKWCIVGYRLQFIMRVDKFPQKADILERATLDTMFSAPAVNPDYAKGWFVNKYGDYSHGGGGPGLQSLVVRTHDGFCASVIVNTWSHEAVFGKKLDELMRQILQAISYWPNGEI